MSYFVSCGSTQPHDHHAYECAGDWYECAGVASRTDYTP